MLNVVTAGLPVTAKRIIMDAMEDVFGEGGVELVELDDIKLKSRVRLSQRNPSDVLVVLDGISHNKCKSIENGLYSSDKYLEYLDDKSLVEFLNSRYNLGIVLEDGDTCVQKPEVPTNLEGGQEGSKLELLQRISDRDARIKTLVARVSELSAIIENDGESTGSIESEDISRLKSENLELESNISFLQKENRELSDSISDYKIQIEKFSKDLDENKSSLNQLRSDYDSVVAKLEESTREFSDQSISLKALQLEAESLRKNAVDISCMKGDLEDLKYKKSFIENRLKTVLAENSQLKDDLSSNCDDIERLNSLLANSVSKDIYVDLENKYTVIESKSQELEKALSLSQEELASVKTDFSDSDQVITKLKEDNQALADKCDNLKVRLQELDSNIILLNSELVQARSTAEMLEKSTSRDTDIEALYKEVSDLRSQNSNLQRSVFNRIGAMSNPNTSLMINLTLKQDNYKNIRFVYSGSTESRKGTYKALLDEFKDLPESEKVLIVDVTSETCVDYVFEIEKVVKGIDWFIKGGEVKEYISNSCLPNVFILSPGLGYVNDCYFLSIDWEARLLELENCGYHVVLYCGDISSMVGRIFHEAFAGLGSSIIYVHGNALGARTIVSNLKGISNGSKSLVCYFEYNQKVEKFYNMVSRTNECRVISLS